MASWLSRRRDSNPPDGTTDSQSIRPDDGTHRFLELASGADAGPAIGADGHFQIVARIELEVDRLVAREAGEYR